MIEHLPLPSSLKTTRPRLVGGDPLLRSTGGRGILGGNGRARSFDDENQLIDELDDDWDEDNER